MSPNDFSDPLTFVQTTVRLTFLVLLQYLDNYCICFSELAADIEGPSRMNLNKFGDSLTKLKF